MAVDPKAVADAFLETYKGLFAAANKDGVTNLYVSAGLWAGAASGPLQRPWRALPASAAATCSPGGREGHSRRWFATPPTPFDRAQREKLKGVVGC